MKTKLIMLYVLTQGFKKIGVEILSEIPQSFGIAGPKVREQKLKFSKSSLCFLSRRIALWCCANFCCGTWIRYTYSPLSCPPPAPLSWFYLPSIVRMKCGMKAMKSEWLIETVHPKIFGGNNRKACISSAKQGLGLKQENPGHNREERAAS